MLSPFRSLSLDSSRNGDPGSKGNKPGEVMCPRHPRSWVEKKVFFVTKTRICPYCELESYAILRPDQKEVPVEPGFGGTPLPERRPSRAPRPRGGPPTPRAQGGRGIATPRAGGPGARGGRGPAGSGTPRQRPAQPHQQGQGGYRQTARTATVRRTAVFKPTQPVDQKGLPPRGAGHGRSFSSNSATTGAQRPKHRRTSSTPSAGHHRRGSNSSGGSGRSVPGDGRPSSTRSSRGGGASAKRGFSDGIKEPPPPPPQEFAAPLTAPSSLPPAGPKKPARSLMFTSAARSKRGDDASGGGGGSAAGSAAASPASVVAPPSPSGSAFSGLSGLSGLSGGGAGDDRRASLGSGPVGLVLPPSITEESAHPIVSVVTVTPGSSKSGGGGGGAAPASPSTVTTAKKPTAGKPKPKPKPEPSSSTAAAAAEKAYPLPADTLAAAERLEPATAREQVRPAAAALAELSAALEPLGPERVGGMGEAGRVVGAADAASRVVRKAGALTNVVAEEGGGEEEEEEARELDDEAAEAAGALLAEAGDAVETFAQTARALVWSGKDPSSFGDSATFADRHRSATAAVSEAARRTELLMGTLTAAADGQGPREKAAAQRRWLSVLDRHEAWMRRRDSRKGLLMNEPEISSGSVTVFKDSQLLPKGTFGTPYAAEYLGMPVSATVLSINTSDPMAAVWSAASAKLLRRTATSELRLLASLVPPHGRLARTHGNEAVVPQVPLRVVNGGGKVEGGKGKDDGPAALVLVGELVEGGSLRGRVKAAAAAAAALSVGSDDEEDAGGEGAAEAAPAQPLLRRRKVLADIAEGLAYLHERGVAHGGLTTENVLLDVGGRAKLSLFGLPDTRRAVAAFRVSSATASEEWDALPASKSAPRRVVDQEGSAWTAPETWAAAAAKQADAERAAAAAAEAEKAGDEPPMAAAAEGEGEGEAQSAAAEVAAVAEALENKKQAAFAADAYAFGMVSWEVLTGEQPWEGLSLEEVSGKVSRGERPPLSFEATSLEGYDNFGDLVRLLWAQDPNARPALQDVARLLRVPEPPRRIRHATAAAAAAAAAADRGDLTSEGEGVQAAGEEEDGEEGAFWNSSEGVGSEADDDGGDDEGSVIDVGEEDGQAGDAEAEAEAEAEAGAEAQAGAEAEELPGDTHATSAQEVERDTTGQSAAAAAAPLPLPERCDETAEAGSVPAPPAAGQEDRVDAARNIGDALQDAEHAETAERAAAVEAGVVEEAGAGATSGAEEAETGGEPGSDGGASFIDVGGADNPCDAAMGTRAWIVPTEYTSTMQLAATAAAPVAASADSLAPQQATASEAGVEIQPEAAATTTAAAAAAAGAESTTTATTPVRSRQPPRISDSPARPLVSSSPFGSTDSSPLHRADCPPRLGNENGTGEAATTAAGSGAGPAAAARASAGILMPLPEQEQVRVVGVSSPPPTLAAPSRGSSDDGDDVDDNGGYFSANEGRSPAARASAAATREAAAEAAAAAAQAAAAMNYKSNLDTAAARGAAHSPAPLATVSDAAAARVATFTPIAVASGRRRAGVVISSSSGSGGGAGGSIDPPQKPGGSTMSGSGAPQGVSSPDPSQLSVASRGGATAMLTPPPPLEVQAQPPPTSQGMGAACTGGVGSVVLPMTPIRTGIRGRLVSSGTPSRREKAGATLRGMKKALSRFGKKKKQDS